MTSSNQSVTTPVISSVSPAFGPVSGGTTVTISGQGLLSANAVMFGNLVAQSFQIINDSTIVATSPAAFGGSVDISVSTGIGLTPISPSDVFTYSSYTPISPLRICDTRQASSGVSPNQCNSGGNTTLNSNSVLNVQVAGLNPSIPQNVTSVVVNITATDATSNGDYLTVFPTGTQMPTSSVLNFNQGQTVSNLVTIGLGTNGDFSIYNFTGNSDVIVDLEGYYSNDTFNSGSYVGISGVRICDTRPISTSVASNECNQGVNNKLSSGSVIGVSVAKVVPSSAIAVVANLTATNTTSNGGYLTAWSGTTAAPPNASNLNFNQGQTVSNRVIIPINQYADTVSIYNYIGSTDVILDVIGYITQDTQNQTTIGSAFNPITPLRICDTRPISTLVASNQCDTNSNTTLKPNSTLSVTLEGTQYPIPTNATEIVVNVTVTNTTSNGGYLSIYDPSITTNPTISDINWAQGQTVSNLDIVPISSSGTIDIYNAIGNADVIVDVMGYMA